MEMCFPATWRYEPRPRLGPRKMLEGGLVRSSFSCIRLVSPLQGQDTGSGTTVDQGVALGSFVAAPSGQSKTTPHEALRPTAKPGRTCGHPGLAVIAIGLYAADGRLSRMCERPVLPRSIMVCRAFWAGARFESMT